MLALVCISYHSLCIVKVFQIMICRSSLINSPMDEISVESSTSYSEQGHVDEVSLITEPFLNLNVAMRIISN
jgi:hypothetical protein